MKVKLSVKDRLTVIALLPNTGKMTDLVEVLELIKLLKFSDEERQRIKYREEGGKIYWDASEEKDNEYDINFEQIRIIKERITELDNESKIDLGTLDTCLKFSKL